MPLEKKFVWKCQEKIFVNMHVSRNCIKPLVSINVFLIRLDHVLFMALLVPMKQESEMLNVVLPFSFHVLEGMEGGREGAKNCVQEFLDLYVAVLG